MRDIILNIHGNQIYSDDYDELIKLPPVKSTMHLAPGEKVVIVLEQDHLDEYDPERKFQGRVVTFKSGAYFASNDFIVTYELDSYVNVAILRHYLEYIEEEPEEVINDSRTIDFGFLEI